MNSVIIVAAGTGSRMNMDINKQFIKIYDKEVVSYTIDAFYNNDNIDEIVVVIREDEEQFFVKHIINKYMYKNIKIAHGGKERQDSVYNGLKKLNDNCNIVIIHDGARPFIKRKIINESIREANLNKAVVVGVPVKDTIKVVNSDNIIRDTPDRKNLWAVQTPQVFNYKLLMDAYENAYNKGYYGTDDAMLVEHLGQEVKMIMGSYENIKITTKEDISFGEQILRENKEDIMRVGIGYDVHKLVENRKLIIGGVDIPNNKGLLGHSDADVLLHAIMDSILGALALGDIGKHFPDNDEKYKGANSIKLLEYVYNLIHNKGYKVNNIDCTIIAQKPKMAPYIHEMRQNISNTLNVSIDDVNVKATTEEGLGFTGREEGISAQSICSIIHVDNN